MLNPKKEIRLVAARLNVKVKFRKSATIPICRMDKREILIPNEKFDRDLLFSIFFHEYAHQVCYDLYIYNNYHRGNRESKEFRRVMVAAEIYVEKMGRKFAKLYDKSIKYNGGYLEMSKGEIRGFLESYYKIAKKEAEK